MNSRIIELEKDLLEHLDVERPFDIFWFDEIPSTMDLVKEITIERDTLIVANSQTKGRGRRGNEWISSRGGLWFNYALPLNMKYYPKLEGFSLFVALKIQEVLKAEYSILDLKLKWPNDILIKQNAKKLAGILIESFQNKNENLDKFILSIGIGLNVNNEVMDSASSLKEITGTKILLPFLLSRLISKINSELEIFLTYGFRYYREDFLKESFQIGEMVNFNDSGQRYYGKFCGLSETGGIIIEIDAKRRTFMSGTL